MPNGICSSPPPSTMPDTSTKRLVEEIDTATRDVYQALRTALHKAEDLKMEIIRQPEGNPFGPEHDEIYKMYLDLSKRFQELREEICDRCDPVRSQPPTPEPAPHVEEPPALKPNPTAKQSGIRPYVLVPVSFTSLPSSRVGDRFSSAVASRFSPRPAFHQEQCRG